MQIQELYDIYDPDIYKVDIGGSCVGHVGGSKPEMEYDEIRIMPEKDNNGNPTVWDNTRPWTAIEENIELAKTFSVNVDQYISQNDHWFPDEITYKKHVDKICTDILKKGELSPYDILDLCDITVDNEPLKDGNHRYVDSYLKYVNWCSEAVKPYRFRISAGNEEFNEIESSVAQGDKNLTEECCQLVLDGVLTDIGLHIQGSCQSDETRKRWTEWVQVYQNRFKLYDTWLCTEANYVNPANRFYSDWVTQLKMALDLKCKRMGYVFIDYKYMGSPYGSDYTWLAIHKEGVLRPEVNVQIWNDLKDLAKKYKSKRILKGAEDGMILQTLYDKEYEEIAGIKYGPYKTAGYLVEWAQMILKKIVDVDGIAFYDGEITGVYDIVTKEAVRTFQSYLATLGYPNIVLDGKWGRKMYGWAVEVLIGQNMVEGNSMDRILHKWASPLK